MHTSCSFSRTGKLGQGVVELLALNARNLQLALAGLPAAITTGKGARTPRAAAVDRREVGQLTEHLGVAERHIDDAVVGEGAHGRNGSRLLATAETSSGDEETGRLAVETAGGPEPTGLVPEGPPLGREVAVSGGDAEEEAIVLLEDRRVLNDGDVGGLGRGVHLGEDLVGEGLGDSNGYVSALVQVVNCKVMVYSLVEVGSATGLLNASLGSLSKLPDVAVHGVLEIVD